MIQILWFGAGAMAFASLLYLALGSRRPARWEHIVFSGITALVSVYFILQVSFYTATDSAAVTALLRLKMTLVLIWHLGYITFMCLYTDWRPPPKLAVTYFTTVLGFGIYNFMAPATLAEPDAIGFLFFIFQVLNASFGAVLIVRERPGKWLILTGIVLGVFSILVDFASYALHLGWPQLGEFCAAIWALFVSIELARDVRRLQERLEQTMRSALLMRDRLNTPIQTLTLGLDLIETPTPEQRANIDRLKRSVNRLTELGRSLQKSV